MDYHERAVDPFLNELLSGLPAVSIEGAKGVGKTATARRHATSVLALDIRTTHLSVSADPQVVTAEPTPLLIDEWQLVPPVWDVVRRAVDDDQSPGRFLLTGSAMPPKDARIHSGAGRIVRLMMRPMTLVERGVSSPTVSLAELMRGGAPRVAGRCELTVPDYAEEILASGLPGVRQYPARLRTQMIESYIDQVIQRDVPELGVDIRRPQALRAWMTAYAAATASTASYTTILDAATPGENDKPARATADAYRAMLERIWLLDPIPAWVPVFNPLKRLAQAPKHHMVDPAIAARLLGSSISSLLRAEGPYETRPEGIVLGALFESLAALTTRVFAQPLLAKVCHLCTHGGDHEIDLIVERDDHKVLAIEVKLAAAAYPADAKHLNWLQSQIGDNLIDKVILNTGPFAYRMPDGTAVVPLALLGP